MSGETLAACTVCDLLRPCEQHHPIPQRAGGKDFGTVPVCRSCHDAIDRMPLERWDPIEAFCGFKSLWASLGVPARLILLKMFAVVCDTTTNGAPSPAPPVVPRKPRSQKTPPVTRPLTPTEIDEIFTRHIPPVKP